MARTGSAVKPLAFALIASLTSVALFAMLLLPAAHRSGKGERLIGVSLIDNGKERPVDLSQMTEPAATVVADPVGEYSASQAGQGESGQDDYLPASNLTERPQVVRDIDPEWHFHGIQLPVLAGVLLINEYGDVDRVLLDEQSLSPMLEEDIRARFLAMRFSPGRLHGRPVKSALRIEVRVD